jgi:hypothetical protein
VPLLRAASKEAMLHHALRKEKKKNRQHDGKQELSNSETGWRSSGRFLVVHDDKPGTLRT